MYIYHYEKISLTYYIIQNSMTLFSNETKSENSLCRHFYTLEPNNASSRI